MATYRIGYGQVEPNHLANQSTKQSYGQLPAAKTITVLENGQFAKYSYADHEVNFNGVGEWMLVWNEIKLYDGWKDTVKDFAMIAENYTPGTYMAWDGATQQNATFTVDDATRFTVETAVYHEGIGLNAPDSEGHSYGITGRMYPRMMKTEVGDIITTNCFALKSGDVAGRRVKVQLANDLVEGEYYSPNTEGYLAKVADASGDFVWRIAKVYTMPDGQPAAKIQRVK